LGAYERKVRCAFSADHRCARWMRVFLYRMPGLSRRCLVLRRQYLLRRYLKVIAGETTYRREYSPLRLLRRLAGRGKSR